MHTYREALRKNEKNPTWVIDLYPGTEKNFFMKRMNVYLWVVWVLFR